MGQLLHPERNGYEIYSLNAHEYNCDSTKLTFLITIQPAATNTTTMNDSLTTKDDKKMQHNSMLNFFAPSLYKESD